MKSIQLGFPLLAEAFEDPAAAVAACSAHIRKALSEVLDFKSEFGHSRRGTKFVVSLWSIEKLAADGVLAVGPVELHLWDFLNALSARMRPALGRRIKVALQVEAACPACRVDPQALEAALLHLAMNARKAMARGGRLTLDARAGVLEGGRPAVSIAVCDDGAGMHPEVAQRVANSLFTIAPSDLRAGPGLSKVDRFVRASGGDMQIRTLAGIGTTVTLNIPCRGLLFTPN